VIRFLFYKTTTLTSLYISLGIRIGTGYAVHNHILANSCKYLPSLIIASHHKTMIPKNWIVSFSPKYLTHKILYLNQCEMFFLQWSLISHYVLV